MRRPRALDPKKVSVYADSSETLAKPVYIGGDYYQDTSQVHLSDDEVLLLAPWLSKMATYIRHKRKHKRAAPVSTRGKK